MGWMFFFFSLSFLLFLSSFTRVDILIADWFGLSLQWLFVHEREIETRRERGIYVTRVHIYAYMLRREE